MAKNSETDWDAETPEQVTAYIYAEAQRLQAIIEAALEVATELNQFPAVQADSIVWCLRRALEQVGQR